VASGRLHRSLNAEQPSFARYPFLENRCDKCLNTAPSLSRCGPLSACSTARLSTSTCQTGHFCFSESRPEPSQRGISGDCCSRCPGGTKPLCGLCEPPRRLSFTSHGFFSSAFSTYLPHHIYRFPSSSNVAVLPNIFSSPYRHRVSPTAPSYDCLLSPSPPIHLSLLPSERKTSTLPRYPQTEFWTPRVEG